MGSEMCIRDREEDKTRPDLFKTGSCTGDAPSFKNGLSGVPVGDMTIASCSSIRPLDEMSCLVRITINESSCEPIGVVVFPSSSVISANKENRLYNINHSLTLSLNLLFKLFMS